MKRILPALATLLLLASSAIAAPAPLAGGDNLPVDIISDNMAYSADKNTVVFSGNVEAVRGEFKMWSEKLTLFLKKNDAAKTEKAKVPGGMEGSDLERIISEHNVRFVNGTQTGSAEKATYFADKSELLLEGNPILHDGDNSIRGNVIRYFINENRSIVEGSKQQRVHAVFSNDKKKGK